jgi:hypothetical protein
MGKFVGVMAAIAMDLIFNPMFCCQALAWGDEGHEVVALIAQARLDLAVRKKLNALLAADTDNLTAHDIAAAATWADKLRDANENGARRMTRHWHFVDLEIAGLRGLLNHPRRRAPVRAAARADRDSRSRPQGDLDGRGHLWVDLLSQGLADRALSAVPVTRHIAASVPGSGVAALRLYRLATMAAEACCPVPR